MALAPFYCQNILHFFAMWQWELDHLATRALVREGSGFGQEGMACCMFSWLEVRVLCRPIVSLDTNLGKSCFYGARFVNRTLWLDPVKGIYARAYTVISDNSIHTFGYGGQMSRYFWSFRVLLKF